MRRQGPLDRFDESVGEDLSVARRSGDAGAVPEAMDAAFTAALEAQGGAFPATDSTKAERDAFRDTLLEYLVPAMVGLIVGGAAGMRRGAPSARNPGGTRGYWDQPLPGRQPGGPQTLGERNIGYPPVPPVPGRAVLPPRPPLLGPGPRSAGTAGGVTAPVRGVPRPRQNVRGRQPTRGQEDLPLGDRRGAGMRSDYLEAGRRWLPRVRDTLRNRPRR